MQILWNDHHVTFVADRDQALAAARARYAGVPDNLISLQGNDVVVRGWVRGVLQGADVGSSSTDRIHTVAPGAGRSMSLLVWEDGRVDAVADDNDALQLAYGRYRYLTISPPTIVDGSVMVFGARRAELVRDPHAIASLWPPAIETGWGLFLVLNFSQLFPLGSLDDLVKIAQQHIKGEAEVTGGLIWVGNTVRARVRRDRAVREVQSHYSATERASWTSGSGSQSATRGHGVGTGARSVFVQSHWRRTPR